MGRYAHLVEGAGSGVVGGGEGAFPTCAPALPAHMVGLCRLPRKCLSVRLEEGGGEGALCETVKGLCDALIQL